MPLFTQGHAIIIGVGGDLPDTVADAEGLAGLLRDPQRCAYPSEQVHLLTGAEAGRAQIVARLEALAQVATSASTLIFYFSGHGYQAQTAIGRAHFLLPFGYALSELLQTAISGQEFADRLSAIPAQKKLILLDCCHAGGFENHKAPGVSLTKAPLPDEAVARLAQGRGAVFIASSQADEVSLAGKPYSAFTLALLEALAGKGNARQDGYVRVADMALHARQMVPRRTHERQHPILNFEQADNFEVAYYAAGQSQPKGLPFQVDEASFDRPAGAQPAGGTHTEVGSGAAAIGDRNIVLGERAVYVRGRVGGNVSTGDNTDQT